MVPPIRAEWRFLSLNPLLTGCLFGQVASLADRVIPVHQRGVLWQCYMLCFGVRVPGACSTCDVWYTLPVQSSNNGLPYIPRCVCCSGNGDGNTFDVLGCWCRHVSKYHRALSCLMGCQYGSRKEPLAFILDCFTSEFSADQSSPLPAFVPVGYFGLNCVICLIRESMKQSYHSRAQTHCCAKNLLSSPH